MFSVIWCFTSLNAAIWESRKGLSWKVAPGSSHWAACYLVSLSLARLQGRARRGPGKELGTDGDSPWQPRDLCLSGFQPAMPTLVASSISLHCCTVTACPCLWWVCCHVGFGILVKDWEIQKQLASLLWNRLVPFLSVSDPFSLSTQYFYYLLLYIPFSFLPRWQY